MTGAADARLTGHPAGRAGGGETDAVTIPAWLRASERYDPPADRSIFIERNLTRLGGMLEQVGAPVPIAGSPLDRALGRVSPGLRLAGIIVAIVCVNATRGMAFSYAALALVLVMLAARPARLILAILKPALAVTLLSVVIGLPALLVGQSGAVVARLAVRAFVAVALVVALARTVAWNRLLAGLRGMGVPDSVVYVCDVTIQFIDILGRSMVGLLDALRLRSVGRDRRKMMSAGRVIGAVFLRAHVEAKAMGEAMACRGFDGRYHVRREPLATWANAAYAAGVAAVVALAVVTG